MALPINQQQRSVVEPIVDRFLERVTEIPEFTISHLIEEIMHLLGQSAIEEHGQAKELLEGRLTLIRRRSNLEPLGGEEREFYNLSQALIDRQGKVSAVCLKHLLQVPLGDPIESEEAFEKRQTELQEKHMFKRIKGLISSYDYSKIAIDVLKAPSLYQFKVFLEREIDQVHLLPLVQALLKEDKVRGKRIVTDYFPYFENPIPDMAFNKVDWETHFGDIEVEPLLPSEITEILKSPCPFWTGKRIEETHLLTLIPNTVNGKLLTLAEISRLPQKNIALQKPSKIHYAYSIDQHILNSPPCSYWILMTKQILPGSELAYSGKRDLVQKIGIPYQFPTTLEAAVSFLAEYVKNGKKPSIGTVHQCIETIPTLNGRPGYAYVSIGQESDLHMASGYADNPAYPNHGAIVCRRFTVAS